MKKVARKKVTYPLMTTTESIRFQPLRIKDSGWMTRPLAMILRSASMMKITVKATLDWSRS